MKKVVYLTVILLGLGGCASKLPPGIAQAPQKAVAARQVQQSPEVYQAARVRWGGEVLEVVNTEETTDVLILGRPLEKDGEPADDVSIDARFIARFPGFQEPSAFPEGQRMTVSGKLLGVEQRLVGEYSYPYPVVEVEEFHRWKERRQHDDYPYYYSPYYGWGAYPGYPWWGRRPYYPYWW
jgi:outer membrane lipoprotein